MDWLNLYGLVFVVIIMIPNIIFAIKNKAAFKNLWHNRFVEITEQIGRYGCFCFMVFNVPYTWLGWWSDESFAVYLIVNAVLVVLYCSIWAICFRKDSIFRTLVLSIIPSIIFLFSGIMSRSVLLIIMELIFAPSHVAISYKNTEIACVQRDV